MPGWDEKQLEAAQLLAVGELTIARIAATVGVGEGTIYRWQRDAAFVAQVDEFVADIRRGLKRQAIAMVERRVARLNRDWLKMQRLIEARAADPRMANVPGGDTGLLAHTRKALGGGPSAEIVDEYTFDAALMREIRDVERQAAQELGQWAKAEPVADLTVKDALADAEAADATLDAERQGGAGAAPAGEVPG